MGLKQSYGAGEVQWMNAGRGLMHEEMWKIEDWAKTDIEIYQIWVRCSDTWDSRIGVGIRTALRWFRF